MAYRVTTIMNSSASHMAGNEYTMSNEKRKLPFHGCLKDLIQPI
jgi:hypothetical protein